MSESEELRKAYNHACDQFDLCNDWEGPARSGVFDGSEREQRYHEHMRHLRREVDRLRERCQEAHVDVSDIDHRWGIR